MPTFSRILDSAPRNIGRSPEAFAEIVRHTQSQDEYFAVYKEQRPCSAAKAAEYLRGLGVFLTRERCDEIFSLAQEISKGLLAQEREVRLAFEAICATVIVQGQGVEGAGKSVQSAVEVCVDGLSKYSKDRIPVAHVRYVVNGIKHAEDWDKQLEKVITSIFVDASGVIEEVLFVYVTKKLQNAPQISMEKLLSKVICRIEVVSHLSEVKLLNIFRERGKEDDLVSYLMSYKNKISMPAVCPLLFSPDEIAAMDADGGEFAKWVRGTTQSEIQKAEEILLRNKDQDGFARIPMGYIIYLFERGGVSVRQHLITHLKDLDPIQQKWVIARMSKGEFGEAILGRYLEDVVSVSWCVHCLTTQQRASLAGVLPVSRLEGLYRFDILAERAVKDEEAALKILFPDEIARPVLIKDRLQRLGLVLGQQSGSGADVPEEFICPMTMDCMLDPVYIKGAGTRPRYERSQLEEHGLDPIGGRPLSECEVISDTELKARIDEFLAKAEKFDLSAVVID